MPLYMFYVWGWARLFGSSEWSLHAANVPWFIAGAVAFILAFPPGDRRRVTAACVVLLCPFAWYYLDEADHIRCNWGPPCSWWRRWCA